MKLTRNEWITLLIPMIVCFSASFACKIKKDAGKNCVYVDRTKARQLWSWLNMQSTWVSYSEWMGAKSKKGLRELLGIGVRVLHAKFRPKRFSRG